MRCIGAPLLLLLLEPCRSTFFSIKELPVRNHCVLIVHVMVVVCSNKLCPPHLWVLQR